MGMHQEIDLNEDEVSYSYADLYRMVASEASIIIYVAADNEMQIRRGLSNAKMKERKRHEKAGFEDDFERLVYHKLALKEEDKAKYPTNTIRLQVSLVGPAEVPIHKVVISDKEL